MRPQAPLPSANYQNKIRILRESIKPVMSPQVHSPRAPARVSAPSVYSPPVPRQYSPSIDSRDVGPVGPPASVSIADIGPVGYAPEMPDWLKEEARLKAPVTNQPQMPYDIRQEAMFGIKVRPQVSDYVAPPVTTPQEMISMRDVSPSPPDSEILASVEESMKRAWKPDFNNRDLQMRDLQKGDLLKGTSRHAGGIGQTQGRTLGEGI
jgi:hypothetical protein